MYMHANSELCFLGAIFTTAGQSLLCRLKLNSATARVSDFQANISMAQGNSLYQALDEQANLIKRIHSLLFFVF